MNGLLSSLPAASHAALLKHAELIDLPLRTILYEPHEVPRYAYFPRLGASSLMTLTATGHAIESG